MGLGPRSPVREWRGPRIVRHDGHTLRGPRHRHVELRGRHWIEALAGLKKSFNALGRDNDESSPLLARVVPDTGQRGLVFADAKGQAVGRRGVGLNMVACVPIPANVAKHAYHEGSYAESVLPVQASYRFEASGSLIISSASKLARCASAESVGIFDSIVFCSSVVSGSPTARL